MHLSSQPDHKLMKQLAATQTAMLAIAGGLASLGLWQVGGSVMRGDSASGLSAAASAAGMLAAGSLGLSSSSKSPLALRVSRLLGAGTMAIPAVCLLAKTSIFPFGMSDSFRAGFYMTVQMMFGYMLLGFVLVFVRVRKRTLSTMTDAATLLLGIVNVTVIAAPLYTALRLIDPPASSRLSAPTIVTFVLLTIVAFTRRAEYGIFSVLISTGIGGKVARVVSPFALVLPFVREMARALGLHHGWFMRDFGMVIASGIASIVAFSVVVSMALRIDRLERSLQDLSLRDSLTGLYNRRGFYLLAEQALWLARRAQKPFSVLYIDLDGLKDINDTLGHETGSAFIAETADLLRKTFRETDAVGRIGGDEFAVAGDWDEHGMMLAALRLEHLVNESNTIGARDYTVRFSLGHVTRGPMAAETLDELLDRADAAMYIIKQGKRSRPSLQAGDIAAEGAPA